MTSGDPPDNSPVPTGQVDEPSTPVRRPPFQFGMATGLVVVTGLCAGLSLTLWHPGLGGALSILVVGSWWSYAAVRARRRKLAYYLAAWPMGVGAFVVGYLPIGRELSLVRQLSPGRDLFFLVIMCLASTVTLGLLRRLIRKPGFRASVGAGILAVYTTAALSMAFGGATIGIISMLIGREHLFPVFPGRTLLFIGVITSAAWVTILLPVAGPLGTWFCMILRRIDPKNTEPNESTPKPS